MVSRMMLLALLAAWSFGDLVVANAQPAPAAGVSAPKDCAAKVPVAVVSARKVLSEAERGSKDADTLAGELELGDFVDVGMTGLKEILDEIACRKIEERQERKLVLFLDGTSMRGLTGILLGAPKANQDNTLRFQLTRSSDNKDAWSRILTHPSLTPRKLEVSTGFENQYPFPTQASIQFRTLPIGYFLLAAAYLLVLFVIFIWLLRSTNICRDSAPDVAAAPGPVPPSAGGAFSLSKVQGAWWFFIILGCYLAIAAVTGDINGTLNSTALTLLGIGAATVVGAAAINKAKDGDESKAVQRQAAKDMDSRISAQTQSIADLDKALDPKAATPSGLRTQAPAALEAQKQDAKDNLALSQRAFKRVTNQSIDFVQDIVSDANGVSFHRFQMVAWTIVLGFIFGLAVWDTLAMPDFDNTLLALQGLSAGTYLGLKAMEPTVPDVAQKPAPK